MTDSEKTLTRPPVAGADAATNGTASFDSAAKLVQVLDRYMADLQAGLHPDRDRVLAENPGLADQLANCLDGLEFIHRAAGQPADEPARLGEFRIVREIGRGGMGVVYEAEQTSLRRTVALKVLRFGGVADGEATRRFQREAETVARLHHTNIVPIFAVGCEGGVHYYAMQLIEGRSLADVQKEAGPPAPEEVARWGLQAAEALEHAHRRGVIHRDVKPSNLLLDAEGQVWLTDFGLARRADEVTLTAAGALLGTPRYMSPEAIESLTRAVDHRTDVYSLGATLYELATGRPVFDARTPQAVLAQIAHDEPVRPRRFCRRFPRDLETILLKCLAKEPGRRYETAQAMADDLRAFLDRRPIRARRPNVVRRTLLWARKHRRSAAVAAVTAFLIVPLTIAAFVAWNRYREWRADALSCQIELATDGPPLKAEVLDERDELVVPTFTVPTQRPVRVPAGSYRVRFSAPGRLSETFLTNAGPGWFVNAKVVLEDRQPWAPIALKDEYAEAIDLAGHTDLLIVAPGGLRRIDGAAGKEVWRVKVDSPEWKEISRLDFAPRPPLLRPVPDLDGDGTGDLVWSSAPSSYFMKSRAWMVAISGRTGGSLWVFESKQERQNGLDFMTSAGGPLVFDADGDGAPDLLAAFGSRRETGDLIHRQEKLWAEAVSGRTGRKLWSARLSERAKESPLWHEHLPFAQAAKTVRVEDRPAVAVVVDNVLAVLDAKSGSPVWPVREVHRPWYAPGSNAYTQGNNGGWHRSSHSWPIQSAWLIGDNEPAALLIDETTEPTGSRAARKNLFAIRLRDGAILWEQVFKGVSARSFQPEASEVDRLMVEDLDGDGVREVILPHDDEDPTGSPQTRGVRVIGGDGKPRWSRTLGSAGFPRRPNQTRQLVGPDLDGDGAREVIFAWLRGEGSPSSNRFVVEALSGRDGRSLWTWSWPAPFAFTGTILPLQWCRDDGSRSAQLSMSVGNGSADPWDTFLLDARTGRLDHMMHEAGPLHVGDLDGDGVSDLVDLDYSHSVRAWRLKGENAWQRLGLAAPLTDLNGDGFADLGSRDGPSIVSGRDGHAFFELDLDGMFRTGPSQSMSELVTPDLDGDGTPDLVGSTRHTRYPPLSAVSGKTGKPLWKNDLGWDTNLFSTTVRLYRDLDGDGRPEIIVAATNNTFGTGPYQDLLVVVSGRDGGVMWQQALTPKRDLIRQGGLPGRFRPGVGDLDGDGLADLAVWVNPMRGEKLELRVFRGRDGARLWSRSLTPESSTAVDWFHQFPMSMAEVADLDGDGRAEVASVCWTTDNQLPRVTVFGNDGTLRGSWSGRIRLFDPARYRLDVPLLVDLAGGQRGVGVAAAFGEPGLTREMSFVVLDAAAKVVQKRPIAVDDSHFVLTRHVPVDLDHDGRDEQLLVGDGRLRASREGLENVIWERTLADLGLAPGSGVEILGSQPGDSAALVVLWTGRELLYLDGATGQTLWRLEGPTVPGSMSVEPGFMSVAPTAGPPRGLFFAADRKIANLGTTVCRPARRVGARATP